MIVRGVTVLLPLLSQTAHNWSDWLLCLRLPGHRNAKEYLFHFNLNPTISWPALFIFQKKLSVALLLTFWKNAIFNEVSDLPYSLCVANMLYPF